MSRLGIVVRRPAPIPPFPTEMVCVAPALIPYMLSALHIREQKYWWVSSDDQKIGRKALIEQEALMLLGCGTEIVEAIDRLYRLQEEVWTGQKYYFYGDGTPEDPYTIFPDIPVARGDNGFTGQSSMANIRAQRYLMDNLVNGTPNEQSADERNIRQQLDDILAAINAGGYDDTEVLAKLVQIIAALG